MINALVEHGSRRYFKATALRHLSVPILQADYSTLSSNLPNTSVQMRLFPVCLFEYFPRQAINSRSGRCDSV